MGKKSSVGRGIENLEGDIFGLEALLSIEPSLGGDIKRKKDILSEEVKELRLLKKESGASKK